MRQASTARALSRRRSQPSSLRRAEGLSTLTTAIIGTGGIGSAIARQLAAGGEALQVSSADKQSAQRLAAAIGATAAVAVDNRSALHGADAVILALRFTVLKSVIDEIADTLGDKSVVVPSNPFGLDSRGSVVRLLPEGQSSGGTVAGWLPEGSRLAMAFGMMSADRIRVVEQPVTRASGPVLRDR